MFRQLSLLIVPLVFSVTAADAASNDKCSLVSEVTFDLVTDKTSTDKLDPVAIGSFDFNFTPAASDCGKSSSLLDTYKTGRVSVKSKGRQFNFVPVFISDKTKYNCYAVKARTACYSNPVSDEDGGFSIKLKASKSSTAAFANIKVNKNGAVIYPSSNTQFFLLHDQADAKSLASTFEDRLGAEFKCSREIDCDYQRTYFLEWLLLNKLRSARPPAPPAGAELDADRTYFFQNVGNSVTGVKKVIQTFIINNEIGTSSPYALGDAVLADSGPSFGSHQIDIATNSSGDVAAFREILTAFYKTDANSQTIKMLNRVKSGVYEKPIREYRVATLGNLYSDWPMLDRALRSDVGKKRYNQVYVKYLQSVEATFQELKSENQFIAKYPWVGFYLIDIDNQYGGSDESKEKFRTAADMANDPADFVNRVQEIMLSYKYSRSSQRAACDTKRRLRNVIVAANDYFGGGTPVPKDCDHQ
ncbi:MAG: hypothetical protein QOJ84_1089 [Bradyrhizobium sp.]|nr:hypothetical protein [Bradyrhizobium sp.]